MIWHQRLKSAAARLWPGPARLDPDPADVLPLAAPCLDLAPEPEPEPGVLARRAISPEDMLPRFIEWMNAGGFAGRYWPTLDIVGFYGWFCHDERLEEMPPDKFLCLLRRPEHRFSAGRRRLNQPMFDDVRAYLARLTSRGDERRAVLYRTPLLGELTEPAQEVEDAAEPVRAEPIRRVTSAGRRRFTEERIAA